MTFNALALTKTVGQACIFFAGLLAAAAAFGAATVGPSRSIATVQTPLSSLSELKAAYRRPSTIPFPAENPYTAEKAALGKKLFFDPRLSASNILSCASCHNPAFGWSDGQPRAMGHGMTPLARRSPAILNLAYSQIFMWDGRANTLEEQALGPIQAADEMNLPLEALVRRISERKEYPPLFARVFPKEGISPQTIASAVATYERTLISGRAPFDDWIDGDEEAITAAAKRGFVLFNTKAGCSACHSEWRFTDDSFHDIGLTSDDLGRGKFLPDVPKMLHAFKTPSLRDVVRRPAFMHDGSVRTLTEVIEHYDHGGINRPSRSDSMQPLGLSAQEKDDLLAFLNSLSDVNDLVVIPQLPR